MWDFWTVNLQSVVSHHPEEKISECAVMREVGMGLDQSSPKSALVINNVALTAF